MSDPTHYDVLVIGSGFGGSVTALRLTEKGYRVGVLEAGQRFTTDTLPKNSWHLRQFVWAPKLGLRGLQRIHVLKDAVILGGAGVGGGSLNYANTLYEPLQPFYDDPQWAHITDWRDELAPHYAQAKRMLGVVTNPTTTPSDREMQRLAAQFGKADTYRPTPVGVFFGRDGEQEPGRSVADPFFGGEGPDRTGCIQCGECMTGCRHGAKNTLVKNYLYLAERLGVQVRPRTTVTGLRQRGDGGWEVETVRTGAWAAGRTRRTVTAAQVVLAAGAYGTQRLLHRMRDTGRLRHLSPRLGELTRTNSESLLGALSRRRDVDFSRGVAITSSFRPAPDTHVEPVRYGHGSNAMGLLSVSLTDGGGPRPRWLTWLGDQLRDPRGFARSMRLRGWSERTVIALVMQSVDNSLVVSGRRRLGRWGLTSRPGHGTPNPSWIPAGNEVVRRLAEIIDGDPGGNLADLVGSTMTAHFLGGAPIGADPSRGVVDGWHRVFGHPGLHVVDGAAVSANLGANPSLTITAQAERAMSFWPRRGDPDPRPPLGSAYVPVAPVRPDRPAVPGLSLA
jgi:cholesterol oxidase